MKNVTEILEEVIRVKKLLIEAEKNYSALNQMDMLSKEGSDLRDKISMYTGMLHSLMWTVK